MKNKITIDPIHTKTKEKKKVYKSELSIQCINLSPTINRNKKKSIKIQYCK